MHIGSVMHAHVHVQTAEDTDAVVKACKDANVQYMDGTMWLHNPRTRYMKEVLSNEHLMGPLKTAISCFNLMGEPAGPVFLSPGVVHAVKGGSQSCDPHHACRPCN